MAITVRIRVFPVPHAAGATAKAARRKEASPAQLDWDDYTAVHGISGPADEVLEDWEEHATPQDTEPVFESWEDFEETDEGTARPGEGAEVEQTEEQVCDDGAAGACSGQGPGQGPGTCV